MTTMAKETTNMITTTTTIMKRQRTMIRKTEMLKRSVLRMLHHCCLDGENLSDQNVTRFDVPNATAAFMPFDAREATANDIWLTAAPLGGHTRPADALRTW